MKYRQASRLLMWGSIYMAAGLVIQALTPRDLITINSK